MNRDLFLAVNLALSKFPARPSTPQRRVVYTRVLTEQNVSHGIPRSTPLKIRLFGFRERLISQCVHRFLPPRYSGPNASSLTGLRLFATERCRMHAAVAATSCCTRSRI
ncbi:hypothetical protein MRX96_033453 [Rhipicephalus microplus]